jgi:CheY-like chemotaxis protein
VTLNTGPTKGPLRVLLVEDSKGDAELLVRELKGAGYEVTYLRVESDGAMRSALLEGQWDVILSDFAPPSFSGLSALAVLNESGIDVLFSSCPERLGRRPLLQRFMRARTTFS